MYFDFWHLRATLALPWLPEILPDAQQPVKGCDVALLRAMAKHIGGDGLDAFALGNANFERQAAVADATAAGCCALACQRTLKSTGRRRTASHKAWANGTLAPLTGEQAAEGQTAGLSTGVQLIGVDLRFRRVCLPSPWLLTNLQVRGARIPIVLAGRKCSPSRTGFA